MTKKSKHSFIHRWYSELRQHETEIEGKAYGLFAANVPCLLELNIPQLWISLKFSPQSSQYLWQYIQKLFGAAKIYVAPGDLQALETKTSTKTTPQLPSDMSHIFQNLSPELLQNASKVAEKIAKQIQTGEQNLQDLTLPQITSELMQSLGNEDMMKMLSQNQR
jgi:DNA polymerase III alpha subunit